MRDLGVLNNTFQLLLMIHASFIILLSAVSGIDRLVVFMGIASVIQAVSL